MVGVRQSRVGCLSDCFAATDCHAGRRMCTHTQAHMHTQTHVTYSTACMPCLTATTGTMPASRLQCLSTRRVCLNSIPCAYISRDVGILGCRETREEVNAAVNVVAPYCHWDVSHTPGACMSVCLHVCLSVCLHDCNNVQRSWSSSSSCHVLYAAVVASVIQWSICCANPKYATCDAIRHCGPALLRCCAQHSEKPCVQSLCGLKAILWFGACACRSP